MPDRLRGNIHVLRAASKYETGHHGRRHLAQLPFINKKHFHCTFVDPWRGEVLSNV